MQFQNKEDLFYVQRKGNGSFSASKKLGEIENASGVGTVGNAKCGDIMRIFLDIDDDEVIRDCSSKPLAAVRR